MATFWSKSDYFRPKSVVFDHFVALQQNVQKDALFSGLFRQNDQNFRKLISENQ